MTGVQTCALPIYLNAETGKLELAEANPLVYVHGNYYELGDKIGKFGWSVQKKK